VLGLERVIVPDRAVDGRSLVAFADTLVSAGGTMNREAAALGVPATSIYAGKWAAIDEQLVSEGRLRRIASRADIESLMAQKKSDREPRARIETRSEVTKLILDER
jgi:predicted glycosyltransferase